jgi:beta-lactamase class A
MGGNFKALSRILGITLLLAIVGTSFATRYSGPRLAREREIILSDMRTITGHEPATSTDSALQAQVEQVLSDRQGEYGVAIRDLDTGATVLVNADASFESASTYKVIVMYEVYQAMAQGTLSADDAVTVTEADLSDDDPDPEQYLGQTWTVADALNAMITVSNNTAAFALTRLVGGWDVIYAAAADLGMSGSDFHDGYFWTTPSDMMAFFQALASGQLISANASNRMVDLLEQQEVNDRIPALLPAGTPVAHKTGDLPGVKNDVGIVYGPGGSYVIAVFSQDADEDEATNVIAQISLLAYQHYGE